ncbi:MAG: MMPL family transporter [Chloroflexi bacterium]|nr:MMPL family transporter [Chloroflexota bacterium]
MFSRWGAFVYRFRRPVAILAVVVAVAMGFFATKASSGLSSGGWLDPNSESAQVADRLASDFGAGRSSIIVLFHGPAGTDAAAAPFQQAIATSLAKVALDPHVSGIVGYAGTHDRRFISTAGDAAYAIIQLTVTDEQSVGLVDGIRAELTPPAGYTLQLTGYGPITKDSAALSETDLQRAETVSLPFVAIILIIVFASIVAAGMPLIVAGLAIPSTLGLIYFVSQQVEMSVYVLNIATMLGLALAIDYSLFIVSRFREELARGRTTAAAVEKAIATSGKAVAFSGFAVMVGLSGLLLFTAPALRSIGLAGMLVVLSTLAFALTFLPAVLGMLGPRVNALSVSGLLVRLGRTPNPGGGRRWEQVATAVMRRPVAVLIPVLALLFVLGSPFFHLTQGVPDAAVYPAGLESRDAYVALERNFPKGETTPIEIVATVTGDPTSHDVALALATYASAVGRLPGIDRVEGAYSLTDPTTGAAFTPAAIAALYATPPTARPAVLAAALTALQSAYVRGDVVRFNAISPLDPATPAATNLIPTLRAIHAGDGIATQVGGVAATGHDFLVSQGERMPYAIGLTLIVSALVLFLLFGSVFIPIKAVVMTLLSISASFGALVWIFQDGNLADVLHFTPTGYTIAGNPIIMFSVIFGLSMDYEVLLLSRIQEAYRRTGDNTASVAEGLARTAGVITGAALIMVSVFAAFALADTITIKSIGVGMAIAVLLDATIVRVLLVPATMRLLGRWNWWAPGPLRRIADRLGFDHVEDEPSDAVDDARSAGAVG